MTRHSRLPASRFAVPCSPSFARAIAFGLALAPLWAGAADPLAPLPPFLPPDSVVATILYADPSVRAAQGQVRVEEANRRKLDAGPYEWSLRVGGQQRRTLPLAAPNERFSEWNSAIERPFRLPGKGRLDAELGQRGVDLAETAFGDAMHEASRTLLRLWFGWLRESASAAQWQSQNDLLGKQAAAIQRRHVLGDAARIERVQAEAALAQAAAQLAQARLREQSAREELLRRFPDLPLAEPPAIPEPAPPEGSADDWIERISRHSHELILMRQASERAEVSAERQRRDRLPDPTIGVHVASERGGEEKMVGAFISIPFAGEARRAASDAARAEAEVLRSRETATARKVASEAAALYHSARNGHASWLASRHAAERLNQAAEMLGRAYQLGEGNLNDLLAARRQANEAALAARLSQLDALEAATRLHLDAHQLWDFD